MSDPTDGVPPPPSRVADLAVSCVQFVERAVEIAPDFTQDTLPLLDHYVRLIPEGSADEVVGLVAPAAGAYFGEVVRRHLGDGQWESPEDDYRAWRLKLLDGRVSFNPVGVALEVATQEDADGWQAFFKVPGEDRDLVREAIDRMGEVSEEDYYSFSVRFEVVEQIHLLFAARDGDN